MKTSAHNTMQHWIGKEGRVFQRLVSLVVYDLKESYILKLIMKLRDISKRLLKSSHTLKPILPVLSL